MFAVTWSGIMLKSGPIMGPGQTSTLRAGLLPLALLPSAIILVQILALRINAAAFRIVEVFMEFTTNSLEQHWMPFTANRDFKANPRIVVKSEGMYFIDHKGGTVLDASSGLFCVPLGHGRPEIADAVREQLLTTITRRRSSSVIRARSSWPARSPASRRNRSTMCSSSTRVRNPSIPR
jgi:hypothetical protein